MMYWGNGMSGWGMLLMFFGNLVFWGLIVAGLVMLVRYLGRPSQAGPAPAGPPPAGPSGGTPPTAQQVLAERYARGEIDDEEYLRRLRILGGQVTTPDPSAVGHRGTAG